MWCLKQYLFYAHKLHSSVSKKFIYMTQGTRRDHEERTRRNIKAFQFEKTEAYRGRERTKIFRDSVWNDGIKHSIHGNTGMKISWLE